MRKLSYAPARLATILAVVAGLAQAQTPSSADVALAETLFNEGKKLMAAGKYADACPKLAESQRLDPGGGTLLNLASCHEAEGKTASAWSEFVEVAAQAQQKGRADIAKNAKQRADALAPKLSKLVVQVTQQAATVEVRRDGTAIQAASFGVEMPLDPGPHTLTATANGFEPWTTTVTLGPKADKQTVTVPRLLMAKTEIAKAPPSSSAEPVRSADPPPAAPPPAAPPSRTGAIVATGVGVVGVSLAVVFGLQSRSKESSAKDVCPDKACASQSAVDESKAGVRAANYANVAGAIGLVGAGVAAYLWTRPATPTTGYVTPVLAPGTAAVVAGRSF